MRSQLFVALALTGSVLSASAEGAIVRCGPNSRPVVRYTHVVRGRTIERIDCVSTLRGYSAATRRPVRYRTVGYHKHRSWKKTALVVGGSTAAGAGVGALSGGKKGALIGGAAGAAAGTAYDVHKRHKRYYRRVRVRS
jgi:hypothetical protein